MVAPTASSIDETLEDADNYGMHERTGLLSASSFSAPAVAETPRSSSPGIAVSLSRIFASYGSIASNRNNNAETTANGNATRTTSRSVRNGDDSSVEVEGEQGGRNSVDIERGNSGSNRQQQNISSSTNDGNDDESSSNREGRESQQQQQQETSDEPTTDEDPPRDGPTGTLTRQLRCLFSAITFPIVPLGTLVSMALLWVLYAATSLDLRKPCSHPLHSYAIISLMLVAYIPNHSQIRSQIFHYSRERDGPVRPARVRVYDQFFHTICLLYVYTGVTLIQTCREDLLDRTNNGGSSSALEQLAHDGIPLNACEATCPNLYEALSVYVATLELFTFALILPLLFLPCIYLWFLQRATAEANEFARLQRVLQEEDALLGNGGVTTGEILDSLESVKIVSYAKSSSSSNNNINNNDKEEEPVVDDEVSENDVDIEQQQLWIFPCNHAPDIAKGKICQSKECCICMSEFDVQVTVQEQGNPKIATTAMDQVDETPLQGDQGTGDENDINKNGETIDPLAGGGNDEESSIVRTRCGHLFHRECLRGWVGGMWTANVNNSNNANGSGDNCDWRKRRARQIHCPLCREDMRPCASRS